MSTDELELEEVLCLLNAEIMGIIGVCVTLASNDSPLHMFTYLLTSPGGKVTCSILIMVTYNAMMANVLFVVYNVPMR